MRDAAALARQVERRESVCDTDWPGAQSTGREEQQRENEQLVVWVVVVLLVLL